MRQAISTLLLLAASLVSCQGLGSQEIPEDAAPAEMYERAGCATCHGADRWGTDTAPGLRELTAHWTVARLAAYIEAPAEHRDDRLDALAERYSSEMPGNIALSTTQRQILAEWLLGYE